MLLKKGIFVFATILTESIVLGKVRIDPRPNDVGVDPEDDVMKGRGGLVTVSSSSSALSSNHEGPFFAPESPDHVTAAMGATVFIPCLARNLGSKSPWDDSEGGAGEDRGVHEGSWIRHSDLMVLTVNSFTFTNDERFSAHRDATTGDWVLVLRHPTPEDNGYYDCSISTKPVISQTVELNVVVPRVEMLGEGDIHLDLGSTLNLTCVVRFSPQPPEFILWYHGDRLVEYSSKDRDMHVDTRHTGDITRSSLLVLNATMGDSGTYACKPSNADRVQTTVHVLKSETPAAMQTTNNSAVGMLLCQGSDDQKLSIIGLASVIPLSLNSNIHLLDTAIDVIICAYHLVFFIISTCLHQIITPIQFFCRSKEQPMKLTL